MAGLFSGLGSFETADMTEKSEFVGKLSQLPTHIQQGLANQTLQVVPVNLYGVKEITNKNHVEIFEPGDLTIRGLRNVTQGQTAAEKYIMLSRLRCRTAKIAVSACAGKSDEQIIQSLDWESPCRTVTSGEWMLGAGATTYMDKTAASVFDHPNVTTIPTGEYKIPGKVIEPQSDIKVELDLVGTMGNEETYRYFVRFDLIGVQTAKA